MRRLAPIDKALLLTVVPLWVIAFALSLSTAARQVHFSHAMVSASASAADYPIVVGFRPYLASEPELRVGDKLLRLGDRELRGISAFAFQVEVLSATQGDSGVVVLFEREGQRREGRLPVGPYAVLIWPTLPVSLAFGIVAILGLLRAPPTGMIRAACQGMMCVALYTAANFAGSHAVTYASFALITLSMSLCGPLVMRALQRFPLDTQPQHAWGRLYPWLFAPIGLLASSVLFGIPLTIRPQLGYPLLTGCLLGLAAACLAIATHSYGKADAIGRRQLKWILFGIYASCLPLIATSALATIAPRFTLVTVYGMTALAIIPICIVVAVARYNLFDVDRLLSATASYNILIVLLGAGALIAVPRAAEAASGLMGIDPSTGQVALSLLLAGSLVPAHRRLRPQIDRIFFKERFALDHGIAELMPTLSACTDARELTQRLGEGLHRLLRPEACVVYASVEHSYAPVFVDPSSV